MRRLPLCLFQTGNHPVFSFKEKHYCQQCFDESQAFKRAEEVNNQRIARNVQDQETIIMGKGKFINELTWVLGTQQWVRPMSSKEHGEINFINWPPQNVLDKDVC